MCETSFDCIGAKICYADVVWLAANETVCGCDTFWGTVGHDCSNWSLHTAVLFVSILVTLCFTLKALFLFSFKMIYRTYKMPVRHKERHWWLNSQNSALASTTAALVGLLQWRLARMIALLTPTLALEEVPSAAEPIKFHPAILAEKLGISVVVFFAMYAALAVSLRWVELAQNGAKLVNVRSSTAGRLWGNHKSKMFFFQITFFGVVLVASLRGGVALAALCTIPFVFTVAVTFVYGLWRLELILNLMVESFGEPDPGSRHSEGSFEFHLDDDDDDDNDDNDDDDDDDDEEEEEEKQDHDDHDDHDEEEVAKEEERDLESSLSSAAAASAARPAGPVKSPSSQKLLRTMSWMGGAAAQAAEAVATQMTLPRPVLRRGGSSSHKNRTEAGERYVLLLREVRFTAALVVLAAAAIIVCMALYAVPQSVSSYKNRCTLPGISAGALCMEAVFNDLLAVCVLCFVAAVQSYLYADISAAWKKHLVNLKRGPNRRLRLRPHQRKPRNRRKRSGRSSGKPRKLQISVLRP